MSASDFEELLNLYMTQVGIDDLKERLRDTTNYRTARRDAVAWLADVIGAEAFVHAAVEAGVLVRPLMVTPDSDDHPVSDGRYVMPEAMSTWDDHGMADHDWRPLYRIASTDA